MRAQRGAGPQGTVARSAPRVTRGEAPSTPPKAVSKANSLLESLQAASVPIPRHVAGRTCRRPEESSTRVRSPPARHAGNRGPHFRGSRTPCHRSRTHVKNKLSQQPQHAATPVCCPGASGPPCVARRGIHYPISCSGALTDGRAAAQARAHGRAGASQRHARGRRARGAVRARGLPRAARGRAHAAGQGQEPGPAATRPRRGGGRVPRTLLGRAAAGRSVRRTASRPRPAA